MPERARKKLYYSPDPWRESRILDERGPPVTRLRTHTRTHGTCSTHGAWRHAQPARPRDATLPSSLSLSLAVPLTLRPVDGSRARTSGGPGRVNILAGRAGRRRRPGRSNSISLTLTLGRWRSSRGLRGYIRARAVAVPSRLGARLPRGREVLSPRTAAASASSSSSSSSWRANGGDASPLPALPPLQHCGAQQHVCAREL